MTNSSADLVAAGREAIERSGWEEALELLQRADEAGGLGPSDLEDLARSAWWAGLPHDCIRARERAHAAHTEAGDSKRAAMVALALAEDHFHTDATPIAYGWLQRAEELLRSEPDSRESGYLTRTQAVIAFEVDDDLDLALRLAERAFDIGAASGDRDLQAITLHDRGRITVASGSVEDGMALMDEAMVPAVAGELSPYFTGKIYCNMIDICEQLADFRRAGDWSEAAKRWCERAGHGSGIPGVCRIHRAEIMRLRGDWISAEEEATRASQELGNFTEFAGEAFYEIGMIRLHIGDYEGAEEAFRRAHGSGRDPQPGMALLEFARGNPDRGWSFIERSLGDATASLKRARLLPAQLEIALVRGDTDLAGRTAGELESIAEEYGTSALRAQAEYARGAVLLAEGDELQAIDHLRRATERWRREDLPYQAARSRVVLGLAYQQHGSSDLAELELSAAQRTFEDLGATPDAIAALRALEKIRDAGDRDRSTTALMFTDIVSSTSMISALGDEAWQHILSWHHRALRTEFTGYNGTEIDNAGDGFFVSFADPREAMKCAIAIQETLHHQRTEHGFAPEVRIGLHIGEVSKVGSAPVGEEVHKAARICNIAHGGEVLASDEFAGQIGAADGDRRSVELKGFAEPVDVVTIPWR